MSCEKCGGKGYYTNFPAFPPKEIVEDKEKLDKLIEFSEDNFIVPCPICNHLEYKIYKLEIKCNTLEHWFRRYIDKTRKKDCEACLEIDPKEIIDEEIPIVEHIITDEAYLASERRRCPVSSTDPEVQEKVVKIIQEHSKEIREEAIDQIKKKRRRGNRK